MTTFDTTCTLPTTEVNFVTGPNTRGTVQILWSCLSILIICTYTVLHLNVPPQDRKPGLIRALSRFSTKLLWMVFTLLAPEYILGKAYSDRVSAKKHFVGYEKFKKEDGVDWTVSHTWLANMGGFTITFDSDMFGTADAVDDQSQKDESRGSEPAEADVEGETVDTRDPAPSPPIVPKEMPAVTQTETTTEAGEPIECSVKPSIKVDVEDIRIANDSQEDRRKFATKHNIWKHIEPSTDDVAGDSRALMAKRVRGAMETTEVNMFQTGWEKAHFARNWQYWCMNMQALESNVWVLDACQLLLARKMGIIDFLPSLTSDQLSDRNKSDFLVKSLAIGQFLWLLIQLIVRGVFFLATSQLEIVTLSFALCTLVTYIFQWYKPKDVQTPVNIAAHRLPTATEIARIAINGPTVWGRRRSSQWIANNSCHCHGQSPEIHLKRMTQAATYGAGLVGIINLIAYEFSFPTEIEKTLWKIASFATLYPLTIGILLFTLLNLALILGGLDNSRKGQRFRIVIGQILTYLAVLPYTFARVYIIFEMFRCLCFAPPETFRATWAVNIPHIG